MATLNPFQKYQEQAVYTMTPGQLIVLLYDEAIKNIKKAVIYIDEKKISETNKCILKAEDILNALIDNLDMSYPISGNLFSLYHYMYNQLIKANFQKNSELLLEVLNMLNQLRDTWVEAERITCTNSWNERKSI